MAEPLSPRRSLSLLVVFLLSVSSPSFPSDIPNAVIVLETPPGTPGSDPAAALPRFVLLKDGQVFVGGTSHFQAARLEKGDVQALRRRADAARKAAGRNRMITFAGEDQPPIRLRLPEDGPTEIAITGDPALAPANLQPLAGFVRDLLAYDNPGLAPYHPASYAVRARAGAARPGGCRRWDFPWPIEQAVDSPRILSASEGASWPTGALPASVCAGQKRYLVTLQPLLPGEQP
ncbi:MAG TPA: hypothetical protein VEQ10_05080 [Vicinamibacteria bacterium]|nr:hypothetical protein [Vicinamibacteria bacterium]